MIADRKIGGTIIRKKIW